LFALITTLAPAPANTLAAIAPNAPVAPVMIAVLPRTSNRESGFLRKSSDMGVTLGRYSHLAVVIVRESGRSSNHRVLCLASSSRHATPALTRCLAFAGYDRC